MHCCDFLMDIIYVFTCESLTVKVLIHQTIQAIVVLVSVVSNFKKGYVNGSATSCIDDY
jgi:hypothetical protein